MTIERLVRIYGTDPAKWPADAEEREGAPDRAEIARAHAEEAALDAALDALLEIEPSDAFVERVTALAPSARRSFWASLADALCPGGSPATAGSIAIAGLALGLWLGLAGPLGAGGTASGASAFAQSGEFELGFAGSLLLDEGAP